MFVLNRFGFAVRLWFAAAFMIAASGQMAQADTAMFSENFSSCTTTQGFSNYPVGGGIYVDLANSADCPGWSGNGWLSVVTTATSELAPVGDKAIWLNEESHSMTRSVSGFVQNQAYRMEIIVWNDNVPSDTGLDVKVGENAAVNFPLSAGEGAGGRVSNFCFLAPGTVFDLRLSEGGDSSASPIVSSVIIYPLADINNCTAPPEEPAAQDPSDIINGFMIHRATQLLQNQPDLIGLLSDDSTKHCGFEISATASQIDCARAINANLWVKATGSWGQDGASQIDYGLLSFGGHHRVNDDLIIGLMAEFDHARDETDTSTVSGQGWLAGPYVVAKLPDTDLYFEGRILAGGSTNNIAPDNTYVDQFLTRRALAQLKVQGKIVFDHVTVEPFATAAYTQDRQISYVDSNDLTISDHTVSLGQSEVGLRLRFAIPVTLGALEVTGGLSSILSTRSARGAAFGLDQRAKAHLGMTYQLSPAATLDASLAYDGTADYRMVSAYLGYRQAF